MPNKGKSTKPKNKNGKKPAGKKQGKAQSGSGGVRALLNNRRYPSTYFSTEKGGEGEMIIKGHEIVGEVNTMLNYSAVLDEMLTPLNFKLFPKLSAIARTFEQYHFRSLKFHFRTGCPATTQGSIMHYVDYNVTDPPAVNAIALLANQTAMVSSVALDSSVNYDVSRQMLPKMFVGGASSNNIIERGNSLRETYCGSYRVFMDKGPISPGNFAGYVYAEYIACFWTPRPPVPVGGAGALRNALNLATGTNGIPLNLIEENTGLPGANTVGATSTYNIGGGLVGALDYAKNVYESGKWIMGALANLSAAASSHGEDKSDNRLSRALALPPLRLQEVRHADDLSVRSWATDRSAFAERAEEKTFARGTVGQPTSDILPPSDWTGNVEMVQGSPDPPPDGRRIRSGVPMASGDVTFAIEWYDVTNGVVDPNFPVTVVGMTFVAYSGLNYNGSTAAVAPAISGQMIVPEGKRYMARPAVSIATPTTRTCTFLQFTSQCQTHYPG